MRFFCIFLLWLALPSSGMGARQVKREAAKLSEEEIVVLGQLRQLVNALEVYRSRYRGYPWSLAHLGPPAEGSPTREAADLIPASLAGGEAGEYLLEYIGGETTAEDVVIAYQVRALPREFTTRPQRKFHVDQGGRIRYTLEPRKATLDDPLLEHPAFSSPRGSETTGADPRKASDSPALERAESAALNRTKRILQALASYRKRYGSYPQALTHLGPPGDGPPSRTAARLLSGQLAGGMAQGYLFIYQAKFGAGCGQIEGYELKVRPQVYARTGRVSYYADQAGVIRFTNEHREPGPNDPVVEPNSV